jgi:hypothetical protein
VVTPIQLGQAVSVAPRAACATRHTCCTLQDGINTELRLAPMPPPAPDFIRNPAN